MELPEDFPQLLIAELLQRRDDLPLELDPTVLHLLHPQQLPLQRPVADLQIQVILLFLLQLELRVNNLLQLKFR